MFLSCLLCWAINRLPRTPDDSLSPTVNPTLVVRLQMDAGDDYGYSAPDSAMDGLIDIEATGANVYGETASDLQILLRSWVNERFAPDLLPFAHQSVSDMLELIDFQEREVAETPQTAEQSFLQLIKSTELERIKFVLANYLRVRLHKIEEYAFYFSSLPDTAGLLMSPPELAYLEKYVALTRSVLHETAIKHLPESQQMIDEQSESLDMVPKPQLDAAVFVRVTQDIGDVHLAEDTEPIAMHTGELYIMRYIGVGDLLRQGKVELL